MTVKEIEQLAESQWEGCHGCDENDKRTWINGFVFGYLNARVDNVDDKIKKAQEKISELLINGNTKEEIIKQALVDAYNSGYSDAQVSHVNDAENYVSELLYASRIHTIIYDGEIMMKYKNKDNA